MAGAVMRIGDEPATRTTSHFVPVVIQCRRSSAGDDWAKLSKAGHYPR